MKSVKKQWSRILSGILALLLLITGMDTFGSKLVAAQETSGYRIEIEYPEAEQVAVLTGNVSEVKENVELVTLTDSNGKEYDPKDFRYQVEENEEYLFRLRYREKLAESVEEYEETLQVVVDGITKTEEQSSEETLGGKDEVPETIPVETLQAEFKKTKMMLASDSTIPMYQYAEEEKESKLGESTFSGGYITKDNAPECEGRIPRVYTSAGFVCKGDSIPHMITGIFPHQVNNSVEWYYTIDEEQAEMSGDYGGINVGYLFKPDIMEIRFYYSIVAGEDYTIRKLDKSNVEGTTSTIEDWEIVLSKEQAKEGEKIRVEFTLPKAYASGLLKIYNTTTGQVMQTFATSDLDDELQEGVAPGRYEVTFEMLKSNVELWFEGQGYDDNPTRYFAVYTNEGAYLPGYWGHSTVYTMQIGNQPIATPKYHTPYYYDNKYWITGIGQYEGGGEPVHLVGNAPSEGGRPEVAENVLAGQASLGSAKTQQVVLDPSDPERKTTVPVGERRSGESVTVKYELGESHDALSYNAQPDTMFVDIYRGKDKFETAEFDRQVIKLPTEKGTTTVPLERGGSVTIKCTETGTIRTDATSNPYYVKQYTTVMRAKMPWYTYEITVSDVKYAFKLIFNRVYNTQKNYSVSISEGIEEGKGKESHVPDVNQIEGSYYIRKLDGGTVDQRENIPLKNGAKFLGSSDKQAIDGKLYFHVASKSGYTKPKAKVSEGSSITPQSDIPDSKGRYEYILSVSQNVLNTVEFTAEPIQLPVRYYYKGQDISPKDLDVTLKVGDREGYLIERVEPEDATNPYMLGYEVFLVKNGTEFDESRKLTYFVNGKESTLWYSEDVISFSSVYKQMKEKGWLDDTTTTYQIRIVPKKTNDSSNAWVDDLQYRVYEQNAWGADKNNSDKPGYGPNEDSYFEKVGEGTVGGYRGSELVLTGYPNQIERTDGSKFILGGNSVTRTIIPTEDKVIGRLYYLAAADVSVDVSEYTEALEDAIEQKITEWNQSQSGNLYTGVNNERHILNIPVNSWGLPEKLPDGREFKGWKFRLKDGTFSETIAKTSSENYDLNLYTLGQDHLSIWNDIFGTGETPGSGHIILVPDYEETYSAITTEDTDKSVQVDTQQNFDVTGTFKYTGQWERQEESFQYALYKVDPEAMNGGIYVLWADKAQGMIRDKVTFDPETDMQVNEQNKTVQFTFHIKGSEIAKEWLDSSKFIIYAWNDKNGTGITSENVIDDAYKEKVPRVTTSVQVIPQKIESENGGIQSITKPDKQEIKAEKPFDVTATFKYDTKYYGRTHGDELSFENIKVALYKKNPKEDAQFQLWADNTGARKEGLTGELPKVETPVLTVHEDGTFSVSFRIINQTANGGPTIDWEWDDGARYQIFAWNDTNGNFTADTVLDNQNKVPSVITIMEMKWEDPSYYVTIPKNVLLTDGGACVDGQAKAGYAGAKTGVTYQQTEAGEDITRKLPEIQVKALDTARLETGDSVSLPASQIGVYSDVGEKRKTDENGYALLGTLKNEADSTYVDSGTNETLPSGRTLRFYLNTNVQGAMRNIYYKGVIDYQFTILNQEEP